MVGGDEWMEWELGVGRCKPLHRKWIKISYYICMHACSVVSNSFVTPWTVAGQAPLSMGFSRQEYGSGLLFPLPRDLHNPEEAESPLSPALAGRHFTTGKPTV